MTSSKVVRVKIRSPPTSSISTASTHSGSKASRHTHTTHETRSSHCSKCTDCIHDERNEIRKSCRTPDGTASPRAHMPSYHYGPAPMDPRIHEFQPPSLHGPSYMSPPQAAQPVSLPFSMGSTEGLDWGLGMGMGIGVPTHMPHEPRLHPNAPAPVLHHLGRGPEPLFGWDSVMPLNHRYGQPRYIRRQKPDYRRFCFSVGKADVPFAVMPGGPLWGMDVTMAPQMAGSHRW